MTRMDNLKALHESIKYVLDGLLQPTERAIKDIKRDGKNLHVHLLLLSYDDDSLETEDPLSLNRGSQTYLLCYICPAKQETSCDSTTASYRGLAVTKQLPLKVNSKRRTTQRGSLS